MLIEGPLLNAGFLPEDTSLGLVIVYWDLIQHLEKANLLKGTKHGTKFQHSNKRHIDIFLRWGDHLTTA